MSRQDPALAKALDLLDRFILFDGHNDLPFTIRRAADGDVKAYGLDRVHQESDTDIPRLREGRVGAGLRRLRADLRARSRPVHAGADRHRSRYRDPAPGCVPPARRAADIAAARRAGRIASVISVESAVGLGGSLSPLRVWYAAGVRILTLCHNENARLDRFGDRCAAPRRHHRLRPRRRRRVQPPRHDRRPRPCLARRPERRARCDDGAGPLVAFQCRALCPHPRNVTDDVLDRVKANGGVVMATFVPNFISRKSHEWMSPLQVHGKTPPGADIDAAVAKRANEAGPLAARLHRRTLRPHPVHRRAHRPRPYRHRLGLLRRAESA